MTDDLLDEATRYGERFKNVPVGVMVLDLIERVQQAEAERDSLRFELDGARMVNRKNNEYLIAERDSWHRAALTATAGESRAERERDEARGKLDAVRARLDSWDATALRDVLAILDD